MKKIVYLFAVGTMALADLTYTVGDAESAGRIAKATHEAYKAAMAL